MPEMHVLITRIVIAGLLGGIIGAGAIMVNRHAVHGLTTAAGIWVAAGIGMAVAVGMYVLGIATTVISLVGLEVFGWLFSKRKAKNAVLKKE